MKFGKYFSIGEVAKLKETTVKTLRHYDKVGLVKPAYTNPENGYRYYSIEQMYDIEFIMMLRDSGTSIEDILEARKTGDSQDYVNLLISEIEKTDMKIIKLQDTADRFRRLVGDIYYSKARSVNSDPYERYLTDRTIIRRPCVTGLYESETYDIFSDAYNYIRDHKLSTIYESGEIVDFDIETGTFSYQEMFIEVMQTPFSSACTLDKLPAGRYLCINYFQENSKEQWQKLAAEMKRRNLQPRLTVQADMFLEVTDYSNPLWELQVLL